MTCGSDEECRPSLPDGTLRLSGGRDETEVRDKTRSGTRRRQEICHGRNERQVGEKSCGDEAEIRDKHVGDEAEIRDKHVGDEAEIRDKHVGDEAEIRDKTLSGT